MCCTLRHQDKEESLVLQHFEDFLGDVKTLHPTFKLAVPFNKSVDGFDSTNFKTYLGMNLIENVVLGFENEGVKEY